MREKNLTSAMLSGDTVEFAGLKLRKISLASLARMEAAQCSLANLDNAANEDSTPAFTDVCVFIYIHAEERDAADASIFGGNPAIVKAKAVQFCENLPPDSIAQILGIINRDAREIQASQAEVIPEPGPISKNVPTPAD